LAVITTKSSTGVTPGKPTTAFCERGKARREERLKEIVVSDKEEGIGHSRHGCAHPENPLGRKV